METSSISIAIKQICDEKGISYESVLETIEAALAAAYRKDFGNKMQNLTVHFSPENGHIEVFDIKTVVEDMPEEEEAEEDGEEAKGKEKVKAVGNKKDSEGKEDTEEEEEKRRFNAKMEIQLTDAKAIKKSYKVGDEIKTELTVPGDFGRMAAQTAKQVITQKLREAEHETLFNEFKDKQGEILIGTVQRREGGVVLIDLGKLTAVLPHDEQIPRESYNPGDHLKVYVTSVEKTTKGPEIVVSRSHPNIVRQLFVTEIPEIASGVVEIKGIAREAGSRTKISVFTQEDNIDPIGSCIGHRGSRVQTIISELRGEKIDIIEYSDDPDEYLSNALSPAKITELKINEKEKTAIAVVSEDQLSLAIGKAGQNVRLAARLTGWKIDIVSSEGKTAVSDKEEGGEDEADEGTEAKQADKEESKESEEKKD